MNVVDEGERSLISQRRAYRRGVLPAINIAVLDTVDPNWRLTKYEHRWAARHIAYQQFVRTNNRPPSQSSSDQLEKGLGLWAAAQRRAKKLHRLSAQRAAVLDDDPTFLWDPFADEWALKLEELRVFIAEHGVPPKKGTEGAHLIARWLHAQKSLARTNQMPPERAALMEEVAGAGWWELSQPWADGLAEYREFVISHQRLPRKTSNETNEQRVGEWMHNQRTRYVRGTLSDERIAAVETVPGHKWRDRTKRV